MFKVEVFDHLVAKQWVCDLTPVPVGAEFIRPSARMTRKAAREYRDARRMVYPNEQLRIVSLHPVAARQLTPKKYAVEMRCTRKDSAHQGWQRMELTPGVRQAARDYVAKSKAYDERHCIVGWKYRIVEVDCE